MKRIMFYNAVKACAAMLSVSALAFSSYAFMPLGQNLPPTEIGNKVMRSTLDYSKAKDYANAILSAQRGVEVYDSIYGVPNDRSISFLQMMSNYYNRLKKYEEAVSVARRIEDDIVKIYGENSEGHAYSLHLLGRNLNLSGDIESGIETMEKARDIYTSIGMRKCPDAKMTVMDLLYCYEKTGRNDRRLALASEEVEIESDKKGSDDYISALDTYADVLMDMENFSEALPLHSEILEMQESRHGKNSKEYAVSLYGRYLANNLAGRYNEARSDLREAFDIALQLLRPGNPDFVKHTLRMAKEYNDMDFTADGARLSQFLINKAGELYESGSLLHAQILEHGSQYAFNNDEIRKSMEYLKRAMSIRLDNSGKDVYYYLDVSKLAGNLSKTGKYREAIEVVEKELDSIPESMRDSRSAMLLWTVVGSDYYVIGNRRRAARCNLESWRIRELTEGEKIPEMIERDLRNDLKGGYENIETEDDYRKLAMDSQDFLQTLKSQGKENTRDYADVLSMLATDYMLLKDYDKAVEICAEAVKILRDNYGTDNNDYADACFNYGVILSNAKRNKEAFDAFREVSEIRRNLFGENSEKYASDLTLLAVTAGRAGDKSAPVYARKANEKASARMIDVFSSLSAAERNLYWEKESRWFVSFLPNLLWNHPEYGLEDVGYDGVLLSKGVLLNTEQDQTELLKSSGDTEAEDIFYRLHGVRSRLSALHDKNTEMRDSLEQIAVSLERSLVDISRQYGDYTANMRIGWRDVQSGLQSGDVAVEFVEVPLTADSVGYMALILKKGMKKPVMRKLFTDGELNALREDSLYTEFGTNLIWGRIAKDIKGASRIYFSPAGRIYNWAVEFLPGMKDITGKDTELHRLSSTRRLVGKTEKVVPGKTVVYGDIDYSLSSGKIAENMLAYGPVERSLDFNPLADEEASRGLVRNLKRLPGTRIEADSIESLLNAADIPVEVFDGDRATEASFRAMSGKAPKILHIGTHGYYAKPAGKTDLSKAVSKEDDALHRSGLYMAGADTFLNSKDWDDSVDDGVLTAAEISMLDLRGLSLVVLSACETGRGDVSGDGVMGLQRGFKKAGAESILMSLWKVDDNATRLLMTYFYDEWLKTGSKYEALKNARERLRKTPGKNGSKPYDSPKYLNAFILLD